MKKCAGCGAEFDDTSKYCPYCGAEYGTAENKDETADEYGWVPETIKPYSETDLSGHGMIWHKVLLFFLAVNGIWTIIVGMSYFSRVHDAEWVFYFNRIAGLQTFNAFCGAAQIGIGVFALTVFNRLRKYRRNGPGSLKTMYIICIVVPLALDFWQRRILPGTTLINTTSFLDLLKNILMLVINNVYYAKRKDLFVN